MTPDPAMKRMALVPDVPGGDIGSGGLPRPGDLSLAQRGVVAASAAADLALRTMVASLVGVAMFPPALSAIADTGARGRERRNMAFYADLAQDHDAAKSFPAPSTPPRVSAHPAHLLAQRIARGSVYDIEFESAFTAVNPAMRDKWAGLRRNNIVHAQHWRHDDGPRPTLCMIHGFMGSAYLFNGLFFSLPWFYRCGYDVLLYTLPFHGRRAERHSPFSGYGYFSHGISGFAEAMAQAVHDFRSVIDYLESTGVQHVALTGMSLGGYTSALIAAVEDRLQAVIPNVPVVSVEAELDDWFPANRLFTLAQRISDVPRADFAASVAYHSPLNYPPRIPRERRLIITGLGDRLAPPEQSEMLWEHWDRCELHWFPGNHIFHLSQPNYLRRMIAFLREFMPV